MKSYDALRNDFNSLQAGVAESDICIRKGVTLTSIAQESRFGFEFFCWRSPEMAEEMDAFVEHAKGKFMMLDVGAAEGVFSLVFQALNPNSKVVAFEPNEDVRAVMNQNCLLSPHVTIYPVALSDTEGRVMAHKEDNLYVIGDKTCQGDASVETTEPLDVITGDAFCITHNLRPDVIKIDVEGHEGEVLSGLANVIKNCLPVIFLEVHHDYLRRSGKMKKLEAILRDLPSCYTVLNSNSDPLETFLAGSGYGHLVLNPHSGEGQDTLPMQPKTYSERA